MDGKAVIGMDAIERRFDGLSAAASDISPTFDTLGAKFDARQDSVFDTNGWGRWAPRAPSTIREGVSPLVQTGIMREGISGRRPIWQRKQGAAFGAPKSDRHIPDAAAPHRGSRCLRCAPPRDANGSTWSATTWARHCDEGPRIHS